MASAKEVYNNWIELLKERNNEPEPHHFNLGNYEFIGTVTDYKFNGIMIDHYTEKHYEIKGLYPTTLLEGLEPNKREFTVNFKGISGVE